MMRRFVAALLPINNNPIARRRSPRKTRPKSMTLQALEARLALSASPGDLDTTFGQNGLVTVPAGEFVNVAIQPGGDILVSDYSAISRYLPNGTLDTAFGANGQLKPADGVDQFAVQPNGDIVVVGSSGLSRYLANGSGLDTSFGNAGHVTANLQAAILAMTIEPNGQIVVASDTPGSPASPASPNDTLARFNSDGSVDTSFGTNGVATVPLAAAPAGAWLFTQSDGKLLLVQNNGSMRNGADLDVARLTATGQLDSSYGNSGQVKIVYENGAGELAAGLAPGDKLVLAAAEAGTSGGLLLSEYNANGALDSSFGASGQTTINDANFESLGNPTILFQSNGQFVVPGQDDVGFPPTSSLAALRRFNADGSVDATFGTNGLVTTSFVSGNYEGFSSAALQPDGKIVAVGPSIKPGGGAPEAIMARYLTAAPTPPVNPAPPGVGFLAGVSGDGTPQTFAQNLYRELLGRDADPASLTAIVGILTTNDSAAVRLALIQGFMNSAEYKSHYVTTLYETILGRAPDAGGLQYWTQKMGSPGTPGQHSGSANEMAIVAAFFGSAEFYAKSGGTPQGWVNALYEDVLGRAADSGALTYLTELLKVGGLGYLDAIARGVLGSPEAAHDILDNFYPKPGGTATTPLAAPGTTAGAGGDVLSLLTGGGWENLYLQGPYGSAPEANDSFFLSLAGSGNWDDVQANILATDQFFTNSNQPTTSNGGTTTGAQNLGVFFGTADLDFNSLISDKPLVDEIQVNRVSMSLSADGKTLTGQNLTGTIQVFDQSDNLLGTSPISGSLTGNVLSTPDSQGFNVDGSAQFHVAAGNGAPAHDGQFQFQATLSPTHKSLVGNLVDANGNKTGTINLTLGTSS